MITNKMITDSHRIAISLAPVKSGNLSKNAIRVFRRRNGFTINYSAVDAYYIEFVEDGTKYQKAQGFIKETYKQLLEYFFNVENGYTNAYNKQGETARQIINKELYRDNIDYRRLIHTQSILQHYQNEGKRNQDGTQKIYSSRGD